MRNIMEMFIVKIQNNKKNTKEWYYMKNIFKILILILVGLSVIGCSLLDEVNREDQERGRTCYERYDGHVRCEDTR